MKTAYLTLLCLLTWTTHASGWNDYQLPIDTGYTIWRCNSLDVSLEGPNGSIYYYGDYPDTGPIINYNVANNFIFIHTAGRKPRNLFQGDTYEEIDFSSDYYFVVDKTTEQITGPLTLEQFHAEPTVTNHGPINWTEPRNPNAITSLVGGGIFLALAAIILGGPILAIALLTAVVVWFFRKRKRANDTPS